VAGEDVYGYEFVEEVVNEDQDHVNDWAAMDDDAAQRYEQETLRKQQEALEREKEAAERMEWERLEAMHRQREAALEAELAKISSEEKRKAFLRQKKSDNALAHKILQHSKHENYYAILGIRNWELQLPSIFGRNIPTLFRPTSAQIKKAYRDRAKCVHPDKSKSTFASEAFVAVEHAASVLLDPTQRAEYDAFLRQRYQERRDRFTSVVAHSFQSGTSSVRMVIRGLQKVLGPFAFPALVLSALII
jgi:hypothetical protein